jgi:transposase-like protein
MPRARLGAMSPTSCAGLPGLPGQHRTKLHSTNPLERLNKEVKRRADGVDIFPNEASIVRLIGTVLLDLPSASRASASAVMRPTEG